ncbi:37S ribosomal protein S22, partial [Ceratobasidium sp. 392]
KVVGESDKHQLRSDAKRLFFYPTPSNTRPTSSSSSSSPSKTPRDLTGLQTSNRPSEWQLSAPNASSLSFSIKGNYKTAIHLGPREGLAFATVAMPAHYAATANVFREIAQRMAGPGQGEDRIEAVVDFGGKSGQGLWASLVAFREPVSPPEVDPLSSPSSDKNANPESWTPISASPHHPRVGISSTPSFYEPSSPNSALKSADSDDPEDIVGGENWTASTVKKYTLLDSRRGMTELARRFVKGTELGGCEILYQDFWGKNTQLTAPERSLALCAFTLSELPNGTSRKRMVTEMWDSGAEWMVVIDHGTPTGFDSVAHARELLLELGRRGLEARANNPSSELDAPRLGSHVVAP